MAPRIISDEGDIVIGYVLFGLLAILIIVMNLLSYAVYFMGIPECPPIGGIYYINLFG